MITYNNVVGDIEEVTKILGEYATIFYDLKKNWKGLSFDNLERKAEEFRSANITKINDSLRHLVNAASHYNNYYLKYKKDYQIAKKNYNTTDDSNADRSIYLNHMNNNAAKLKEAETYIKNQLAEAAAIKTDASSKINFGTGA